MTVSVMLASGYAYAQAPQPAADQTKHALSAPEQPRAVPIRLREAPDPKLAEILGLLQAQGEELEALRGALREQQALTARLEARLGSPPAVVPTESIRLVPAERSSEAASTLASQLPALPPPGVSQQVSLPGAQNAKESSPKNFGPFTLSGDLRLRAEPTFGGPVDRSQDRFRERIRLRVNAEARLNDQLSGGFSLASGDLNDPISTNQTTNQYDTRKPIAIDRAYATYHPSWFRPLTITAGKFAYPWFNTELVWDKDLNPEGAAETLSFNIPTPSLKKVSVVAFQLPFAENRRTGLNDKSFFNTMVYGEQLQTFWQLGGRVKLSAYTGFYDWKYADSIAVSLLSANSASPADGLLALRSAGVVNSIATATSTNAITGAKTLTSAQFASRFGILDSLFQLDIQTPSSRWPITLIGDFSQNTRACSNVPNISIVAVYSAPCDAHARHGYWLDGRVGRTERQGDWQFSYTRIRIEREAVIGAFNYSEIFPANNVEIHRAEILYQLFHNVTLQMNALIGRPLVNSGSPPPVQPLWERLQFDMTYKF